MNERTTRHHRQRGKVRVDGVDGVDAGAEAEQRKVFHNKKKKKLVPCWCLARFANELGLRVAISTAPYLSGSGRVDMLTRPVEAARAAVATGASG